MKGNIVRIGPKTKGYGFILGEDGNDPMSRFSTS